MSMEAIYFKTLVKERDGLIKTTLWKEILKELLKKKNTASRYCETEREDVRFYQGRVSAFGDILGKDSMKIINDILLKIEKKINIKEE